MPDPTVGQQAFEEVVPDTLPDAGEASQESTVLEDSENGESANINQASHETIEATQLSEESGPELEKDEG